MCLVSYLLFLFLEKNELLEVPYICKKNILPNSTTLKIRAIEPEDLDFLFGLENDPEVWKVSETTAPVSRNTLRKFIESSYLDITQTRQARFIIVSTDKNLSVGTIDLFDYDPINRRIGIGVLIAKEYRGNHLAKEALNLTMDYCFNTLFVHQIFCNIQKENQISLNLFQQLGFAIVGIKKDWYLFENQWKDEYLLQKIK